MTTQPVLRIQDLSVGLTGRRRVIEVVSAVNLEVRPGEILGLVGESGCGKSTLAVAALGLFEPPLCRISGSVNLTLPDGRTEDLLSIPEGRLRQLRWRHVAYIPQGSMSALNPVLKIRQQMTDTLVGHGMTMKDALEASRKALAFTNLDPGVLERYPHELSGGMMQRVAIAAAVSMGPSLLIADEPTTALDVVTQRLILQELERIRQELGTTIIVITHDMGVIAQVVDRMAVMYAGRIVESGPVSDVFGAALHPYASGLIQAIPRSGGRRVSSLVGETPTPFDYPAGCRFHPRCPRAMDACRAQAPDMRAVKPGHQAACHLYGGEGNTHD
jgi:peptide/nickel transport system ATP-binding protein